MEAGRVALDSSMAMIVQQLQMNSETQVAVMKKMVESQQEMAEMLASIGIGQNVDVVT
jgi:3-mercaptopyruvate sulfurtransferase SseA